MKNFFALLSSLLMLGTVPTALAQTQPFAWGVTGGVNLSRLVGKDISRPLRPGYRVGLVGEYRFATRWTLVGELVYSSQNGLGKVRSPLSNPAQVYYQNQYIILPLLLRFDPRQSAFFLEAGPQAASSLTHTNGIARRFGFGLVLGVGYRLGKHVIADARFTQDVVSRLKPIELVFPDQGGRIFTGSPARTYNQGFSTNLTYIF